MRKINVFCNRGLAGSVLATAGKAAGGFAPKSSLEDKEPPLLGARSPSPALSAEREQGLSAIFKRSVRYAGGRGARAPSNGRLDLDVDDFWGKAAAGNDHPDRLMAA